MADDDTLMAYLVPRLTGGVEDAATEALAYILNKSEGARAALDDLLCQNGFDTEPVTRVRTQVSFEDGCIPDMVGYDEDYRTRLLVESKFWAAFGDGQVSQYALHLDQPGPAVLLIIGPEVRRQTLWAEAKRQMAEVGELEDVGSPTGVNRARVNWTEPADSKLHLMIISWAGLLDLMAAKAGDAAVLEDIRQLRGLAQRQDNEAFLPLHSENLNPDIGRRYRGYCRLVDAAVDARGVPEKWIDITRLAATSQRWGYGRYLRFSDVETTFWFGINHYVWAKREDTPLWLGLYYDNWNKVNMDAVGRELDAQVVEADWFRWVPIRLRTGVEYDDVLDDVTAQLRRIGAIVSGQTAATSPPS